MCDKGNEMGRAIRINDLKSAPPGAYLLCRKCGAECSANYEDYLFYLTDKPFKCCKVNMLLVTRTVVVREVGTHEHLETEYV